MTAGPKRVLVVDDDARFLETVAHALQVSGLEVLRACDLATARRLPWDGLDVALVDLMLPDGLGTVLVPELRARCPGIRAYVVTASASITMAVRAVQAGAEDVLPKYVGAE